MSYFDQITTNFPTNAVDAFGRLRVSSPYTQFDSKQCVHNDGLVWDTQLLSGTSTFQPLQAQTAMFVSGTNGAYAVRQTFTRPNYVPGKGQLFLGTATDFHPQTNCIKRIGVFNSNYTAPYQSELDGWYWQSSGTIMSVNIGNLGVIESAAQSAWNIDKFDGTGPSRLTLSGLSFQKNQIYAIQYQWLGVGQAVFGLDVNGILCPAHAFNHANSTTGVYCSTPNHSVRYQLNSIGGSGSLNHICSTIQSEGGTEGRIVERSISTGKTKIDGPAPSNDWGILAVRIDPTVTNAAGLGITVDQISIMATTATSNGGWSLVVDPVVAGTPYTWQTVPNFSGVQYAVGGATNILTGGTPIHGGLFSNNTSQGGGTIQPNTKIGVGISGNAQTLVLSNWEDTTSPDMFATMSLNIIE